MRISRRQFALAGIGAAASPSVVSAIASAINHQESSNPSYNNPGDLRYAGQAGATGAAPNGMAIFSSLQAGQQAEVDQINLDITRGSCANGLPVNTIADLITCWAPPSENPTATYIANVGLWTGLDTSAPFSSLSVDTSGASVTPDSASTTASQDTGGSADASVGAIDWTDPTTLLVVAGVGALAVILFGRG